jgi:tetratricopeptide (TPR) repeat protein
VSKVFNGIHCTCLLSVLILTLLGCTTGQLGKAEKLVKASMYNEAIPILDSLLKTDQTNVKCHYLLGISNLKTDHLNEMEKNFTSAVKLNQKYAVKVLQDLDESFKSYIMNSTFSSALYVATTATKIDTSTSSFYRIKISKILGDLFVAKDYEHAIQFLYSSRQYPIGAVLKQASKDIYKQWYICHSNNQQSTAKQLFAYAYSFAPEYVEDDVQFKLAKADYLVYHNWKAAESIYTELNSTFDSDKLGRDFTLLKAPRTSSGIEIWKIFFHSDNPISISTPGRFYTLSGIKSHELWALNTNPANPSAGEMGNSLLVGVRYKNTDDQSVIKAKKGTVLIITWSDN